MFTKKLLSSGGKNIQNCFIHRISQSTLEFMSACIAFKLINGNDWSGIVNNGLVNPCENNIQQAASNCSKYIRR